MSVGHQPPTPSSSPWTEPPWSGWIETTGDALLILEAARQGRIPRVTRRLVDSERRMITSGSVFVFDEDESGIKRWTDGFFWSPSRILGNFLLYRETDKRGAGHRSARAEQELMQQEAASSSAAVGGLHIENQNQSLSRPKTDNSGLSVDKQRERALIGSLTNSYKFKPDGLMKKTFSVTINGVAQHLISYYKIVDVESGRLRSPSSLPEFAALDISPEYLDKTHFRNPPKVEIGVDGIPRYRGESDDIDGNGSMNPTYQTGLIAGQGVGDMANNMLGGPVLATEQRHPNSDHHSSASGNINAKRNTSTRYEPYGSPPQQKRSRKNTRTSEPPTGPDGSDSSTSTSTSDHQPHGMHQSPQSHQMSVSPHLTAPQHHQSGTYDPALQQQYQQQHQSLQQRLHERSQLAQQQQTTQYQQQQQPAQQTQQPSTVPYPPPPPQFLPFYSVPPPAMPGYPPMPPPGAAGQPPQPYGQYANPYGPTPYWQVPNMPTSGMATSPMSTSSDSPSPSPMHLTPANAHAQHRRSSIGGQSQNPTSGLQNVAAVGTNNNEANAKSNTTNTRNDLPGHRSDPSQKPPGQVPRQEPPVLQHHHPPASTASGGSTVQGSSVTSTTTTSSPPAGNVNTGTGVHTSTSTPTPGASPLYPFYSAAVHTPGHPHPYAHMPPPGPAAPVMGSLTGQPHQSGAGPPGQPPASMPMGMQPVPMMQGMSMGMSVGPPGMGAMGMPPMSFGPGPVPYQWPPHPPPPGAYMAPGVYGPYGQPFGLSVPAASGAGQVGSSGGGAVAGQGQGPTQTVGTTSSASAGSSSGAAATHGGGGGGARAGSVGGRTAES